MGFKSFTFFILIASPGDLAEDRDEVERQVHRWNVLHAEAERVTLIPPRWETSVRSTFGTPAQASINTQIVDKCDALIGMFWHRLGTKTAHAESGTVDEIERMAASGKEVMLYFSDVPVNPSQIKSQQLKGLAAFKQSSWKTALPKTYATQPELCEAVFDDLMRVVRDLKANSNLSGPSQSHAGSDRKVTWKIDMKTDNHARFLTVDVVNEGVPLHMVHVVLEYPGMTEPFKLASLGETPEPFNNSCSCRYYVRNDDPTKSLDTVLTPDPSEVFLVIKSRVLEIERIPATKFLETLKTWASADPSLPPPPRTQQSEWRNREHWRPIWNRNGY